MEIPESVVNMAVKACYDEVQELRDHGGQKEASFMKERMDGFNEGRSYQQDGVIPEWLFPLCIKFNDPEYREYLRLKEKFGE